MTVFSTWWMLLSLLVHISIGQSIMRRAVTNDGQVDEIQPQPDASQDGWSASITSLGEVSMHNQTRRPAAMRQPQDLASPTALIDDSLGTLQAGELAAEEGRPGKGEDARRRRRTKTAPAWAVAVAHPRRRSTQLDEIRHIVEDEFARQEIRKATKGGETNSSRYCEKFRTKKDCPRSCAWYDNWCFDTVQVNFGGSVDVQAGEMRFRPQWKTSQRFNNDANKWESCSGTENCLGTAWSTQEEDGDKDSIRATMSNPKYTKLALEVVLKCQFGGRAWFRIMKGPEMSKEEHRERAEKEKEEEEKKEKEEEKKETKKGDGKEEENQEKETKKHDGPGNKKRKREQKKDMLLQKEFSETKGEGQTRAKNAKPSKAGQGRAMGSKAKGSTATQSKAGLQKNGNGEKGKRPFVVHSEPGKEWTENVNFRLWYNLQEVRRIKSHAGFSTTIWLPEAAPNPILRVEMSRADPSLNAKAAIGLQLREARPAFDSCMQLKARHGQCLNVFNGTEPCVRSSQHTQYACLTGDVNVRGSIRACVPWYECMSSEAKKTLVQVLRAYKTLPTNTKQTADFGCEDEPDEFTISFPEAATPAPAPSTERQRSGPFPEAGTPAPAPSTERWRQRRRRQGRGASLIEGDQPGETCVDPSSMDVEALECECFAELKDKSEDEIKKITCQHKDICQSWKDDACAGALEEGTPSLLIQRSEAGENNTAGGNIDVRDGAAAGLDGSMKGKCGSNEV